MGVMYIYKKGFTLAEVLITLGIIGVVATLTMPSLITNYQKKETTTRLHKVYNILRQATVRSTIDNGDVKDWDFEQTPNDFFEKYYVPYLLYTKKGLLKDFTKVDRVDLNNNTVSINKNAAALLLPDGTFLWINQYITIRGFWGLVVDLNGDGKPNKVGRDVFAFSFGWDDIMSYNQYPDTIFNRQTAIGGGTSGQCNKSATGGIISTGSYCSRVIELDGWEIAPDYPW